jgi:hypothetical protein
LLALILFGIGAPMFLGFILIGLDTRPDLSDGRPREAGGTDSAIPVGWPSLTQDELDSRSRDGGDTRPKNGALVKMLGYMMDGYQFAPDGTPARMFVLMPGAGHFLHPAHRIPDEMVEVWPKAGTVVFKNRELVWAKGRFEELIGAGEERALYAIREAEVTPASQQDIAGWFAR